jgi:broad specificity phosphatase PhoE
MNAQLIYVVRHGETDANVNKQVNDRNVITPLNSQGKAQAKKTGIYFRKEHCDNFKCIIYTSPSIRAVQTSEIIAKELKINPKHIIQDDRLNELDHGLLSGSTKYDKINIEYMKEFNKLPKDPIKLELSFEKFDKLIEKKFKVETIANIKKRILSFYKSLPKNKKNIIVVTHGGIVQGTLMTLFNIKSEILGDLTNGKNCSINCIAKEKNKYALLTIPNTLHLR